MICVCDTATWSYDVAGLCGRPLAGLRVAICICGRCRCGLIAPLLRLHECTLHLIQSVDSDVLLRSGAHPATQTGLRFLQQAGIMATL